jgi:hypothetical protein
MFFSVLRPHAGRFSAPFNTRKTMSFSHNHDLNGDIFLTYFYAPVSKDWGHIVFGLSVCLSAKTLTLAISFEW